VTSRAALGCFLLVAALSLSVGWLMPNPLALWRLSRSPVVTTLPIPVEGVRRRELADTWGAARSEGRSHQGIDIFARRGAAVYAPVGGIVIDVGVDRLGGNVVRLLGPGLQVHYFAHLDRYGTFVERDWVQPGEILGYVGSTGNARGTPPHLHYGIYDRGGRPLNPFPILIPAAELSPR
jgi:murein DD-endopeptidase MepM/ murein hydrolase activator NlpD